MNRSNIALYVSFLCVVCASGVTTSAHDFVRHSPPQSWYEPLVPEDLPKLEHPSYFEDLDKARAQVSSGRYKHALATLYTIKDAPAIDVALIKGEALAALGRTDEALSTLSAQGVIDEPRVQVLRALVLSGAGRNDEALELLRGHLKAHPDSLAGHYHLGAISERIGDTKSALDAYAWFFDEPQRLLDKWQGQPESFENAADVTLIARALDRHSTLTGAYQNNPQLHDLILNMFVKAYDVIDRNYWPARVAAAEYFMSHDQRKEAGEELAAALEANPNDARALWLMGLIALDTFDFDKADLVVSSLRDVDAQSPLATIIEARSLLTQRRPKEAEPPLKKLLERQPKNLEALGLLAAAAALQLKDDETTKLLKQVESLDPDNASAYYDVAEQLGAMRQYPRAAEMYNVAIERAPWWTAPRNGLGLLYTQSGDEDEARVVLDAATRWTRSTSRARTTFACSTTSRSSSARRPSTSSSSTTATSIRSSPSTSANTSRASTPR